MQGCRREGGDGDELRETAGAILYGTIVISDVTLFSIRLTGEMQETRLEAETRFATKN